MDYSVDGLDYPIMRNEEIDKKLDELEQQFHIERREDRKVLNESLSKLTEATTELTMTVRELSITKDVVNAQISELRVDVSEVTKNYNAVDKHLGEIKTLVASDIESKNARIQKIELKQAKNEDDFYKKYEELKADITIKYERLDQAVTLMRPVVESNNKAKENAQNRIMDLSFKIIQFGVMGGILYKLSTMGGG